MVIYSLKKRLETKARFSTGRVHPQRGIFAFLLQQKTHELFPPAEVEEKVLTGVDENSSRGKNKGLEEVAF